jgi:glutathione peroxidase-family protein
MNRVPDKLNAKAKAPCPVLEDYGIRGTPTGVLIDRQGRVVGRFDPRSNRDDAILERVLKER